MSTSAQQARRRPRKPEADVTPKEAMRPADRPRVRWLPEPDALAHDRVKDCDVLVVVGPGVYDRDKAYVRPLDGQSAGWLAPCDKLEPVTGRVS